MKLESLKIVISGAAGGMGRHFALRLAEAGADVAIGDVNEDGLKETVSLAKGPGGTLLGTRTRPARAPSKMRWSKLNRTRTFPVPSAGP